MADQETTPGAAAGPRGARNLRVAGTALLVLLAVANGAFCLAILPGAGMGEVAAGAAAMVLATTVQGVVGWRRPVVGLAVIAGVATALVGADTAWRELTALGGLIWTPLAMALATGLLANRARRPVQLAAGGALLLGYVVTSAAAVPFDGSFVYGMFNTASPVFGGIAAGLTQRLLQARRERLRHEARERELLAERTRVAERRRLAAEMHDAVSHQISLMVLQAGALGAATPDAQVRAAADEIRTAGSKAIDEVRRIVGVLHEDRTAEPTEHPAAVGGGAPAASEAAGDPATLVAEARAVGQDVRLDVDGDPSGAPPHTARAVYRVVQEALTNARKYAPGAAVRVRLRYQGDAILADVGNTAPTTEPDPALSGGSGAGLEGLRHRVELLGGTLNTGATSDGGFHVSAILPARPQERGAR